MSIIHRLAQPDDLNGLLALYRELRPQDAPLLATTRAVPCSACWTIRRSVWW
ncbi:hypothetical protein M8494_19160 [Serratia ureilytica]